MAIEDLQHVQSGGLITATFINRLVDELIALEGRVETLENEPDVPSTPGPGPPVLTSRQPPGTVQVGSLLTLFGHNFAPLAQTRVNIGPRQVTSFGIGSGDTRLTFQVPEMTDLPRNVNITVSTPQGTSNPLTGVRVEAKPPLQGGEAFIDDLTDPLGQITAGSTYTLTWRVRSETLLPATYDFSVIVSDVDPVGTLSAWQSNLELSDEQAQIAAGSPLELQAEVTVPASTNSATIALHVESVGGQFQRTSTPITLTVGETPEQSDQRVQLVALVPTELDPETGDPNPVHLVNGVYEIEAGAEGIIRVEIQLQPEETEGGRYEFRSELEDDGGGKWVAGPIAPVELLIDPGEEPTVNFGIENAGTVGSPPPQTFFVVRAAKRNDADTADEYVSFTRIPIRGFGA